MEHEYEVHVDVYAMGKERWESRFLERHYTR